MKIVIAACTLLLACQRPQPVLICHNSNCTGELDLDKDDTMAALESSLRLGPSIIDGVEVDAVWSQGQCWFAHHADSPGKVPFSQPLVRIADYLATTEPPLSGAVFTLWLELKAEQSHAKQLRDCALQALAPVIDVSQRVPVQLLVSSFSSKVLRGMEAPTLSGRRALLGAEVLATGRDPAAFNAELDFVSVATAELDGPSYGRYQDSGLGVALWGDRVTSQFLDDVTAQAPQFVSVGEAQFMRAWMAE